MSKYSASEKKSQCFIVPLTGLDVDNFYAQKMSREVFLQLLRTKVRTCCHVFCIYVTEFTKTVLIGTRNEIQFIADY